MKPFIFNLNIVKNIINNTIFLPFLYLIPMRNFHSEGNINRNLYCQQRMPLLALGL